MHLFHNGCSADLSTVTTLIGRLCPKCSSRSYRISSTCYVVPYRYLLQHLLGSQFHSHNSTFALVRFLQKELALFLLGRGGRLKSGTFLEQSLRTRSHKLRGALGTDVALLRYLVPIPHDLHISQICMSQDTKTSGMCV